MSETDTPRQKAFVLMPFDDAFTDVYEKLIKTSFENAGFSTYRADDIESQRNILSDIVSAIATSDVIIADLTDSNPNVYYELGLAHALKKPVVLLTQDIGSVPFDLRSYRVLEYDTHFARFEGARDKLAQLADQIATGDVVFGNPVSDFGPRQIPMMAESRRTTTPEGEAAAVEADEPGILDSVVESEEALQELTNHIIRIGELVSEINDLTVQAAPELQKASKELNVGEARSLLRTLGTEFDKRGNEFPTLNAKFQKSLLKASNALEIIVLHMLETGQADDPRLRDLFEALESFKIQSLVGKESMVGLTQAMNAIPRMERTFDRSRKKIAKGLEEFIDNIDQLISMAHRVQTISADTASHFPSPENE